MTTQNSGTGSTGSTTTVIDGLIIDVLAGVMPDDHEALDGGRHSMSTGEEDAGTLGIVQRRLYHRTLCYERYNKPMESPNDCSQMDMMHHSIRTVNSRMEK